MFDPTLDSRVESNPIFWDFYFPNSPTPFDDLKFFCQSLSIDRGMTKGTYPILVSVLGAILYSLWLVWWKRRVRSIDLSVATLYYFLGIIFPAPPSTNGKYLQTLLAQTEFA